MHRGILLLMAGYPLISTATYELVLHIYALKTLFHGDEPRQVPLRPIDAHKIRYMAADASAAMYRPGNEEDKDEESASLDSFAGLSEINGPTKIKLMMNAPASSQLPVWSAIYRLAMREQLMRGYVGESVYNNFLLLQDESGAEIVD